jgi:hypothetical protein
MRNYTDDPEENDQDSSDEWSSRDPPITKSFYEKYGYDEREGPPEEEEDRVYIDDRE